MKNKNVMVFAMAVVVTLSFLFCHRALGKTKETMAINIQDVIWRRNSKRNIEMKEQDKLLDNIEYDMKDQFKIQPLTQEIKEKIMNNSWKDEAPYSINDLRHVKVVHWGFDDKAHEGELIVHEIIAQEVVAIFKDLLKAKFPIEKIKLIDEYDANDNASMNDNNTSALCVREVTNNKNEFSRHTFGIAIDINPVQNPYIKDDWVLPQNGFNYIDRRDVRKGMIIEDNACYNAFVMRGWTWGGHWKNVKDYQHFHKDLELDLLEHPQVTQRQFKKLWVEAVNSLKEVQNPQGKSLEIKGKVYQACPDYLNKNEKIEPYLRNYFTQDYASKIIDALDMVNIGGVLYYPGNNVLYNWMAYELKEAHMLDGDEDNKTFKVNLNHQEITVKIKYVGSQGWRIHSIKP